jgi:hypothetical protein
MVGGVAEGNTAGYPSQDRTGVRHVTVLIDLRGVLGGVVLELLKDAYGAGAVGEVPSGVPLAHAVNQTRPKVVVTALDDDADPAVAPRVLTRLLEDHPRLRILVVEGGGRSGSLWELRPTRTRLGELSPQLLIRAIHGDRR